MSTVTERETATFVLFGLICSTAATAIPLKPIANRSPHERLVWRRLSRTCGTDLLRFCGLWGFFADARRENAMRWSCAGRKGTKPLLVGIMPGNGKDRVTDGSCERRDGVIHDNPVIPERRRCSNVGLRPLATAASVKALLGVRSHSTDDGGR
jgi:hypothetical protein